MSAERSYFLALLMALALALLLNRGYLLNLKSGLMAAKISWELIGGDEVLQRLGRGNVTGLHLLLEREENGTVALLEISNGILYPGETLLIVLRPEGPLKLEKVAELSEKWGKAVYFIFSEGRGEAGTLGIKVKDLNLSAPAMLCLVRLNGDEMRFVEVARVVDPSKYIELRGVIKRGSKGVLGLPFKLLLSNTSSPTDNATEILKAKSGLKGSFLIRLPKEQLLKRGKFLILVCKGRSEYVKLEKEKSSYSLELSV